MLVGFDCEPPVQAAILNALRERYCEADIHQALTELRFDGEFAKDINLSRNRLRLPYIVKFIERMVPTNAKQIGTDSDGIPIWGKKPRTENRHAVQTT